MKALVYNPEPVRWTLCKALGWFWPAAYWSGLSGLRYRDIPVPALPT